MYKKFTIIICCYNSGDRIERVVDNILIQKKYNDLVEEILIIDNNSNDNTNEYIEKCLIKDKTIRTLFEEKQGLTNARKKGVDNCKTDWIIFVDDDNFMEAEWIYNAHKYIEMKKNVGAFNGIVIPKITKNIDSDMLKRLEASLKPLACTHLDKTNIKQSNKSPFRVPIGAGLVINSSPLKELSKEGWLKVLGRKGNQLSSGEDGEMSLYVKQKGYDFGFCNKMVLNHEISEKRLEDDYLNKLWNEMGIGVYNVIDLQKMKQIKKIVYLCVINLRGIVKKIFCKRNKYKYKYYKIFIEGYKSKL